MKRIIGFLKSETLVFLTLSCVFLAQIVHTMYVFEHIRVVDLSFYLGGHHITILNWLHAFIFAVAIEAAILMFVLNGKLFPSKIYAVASFATNILYYGSWHLEISEIIATVIASGMLAGSIWFFSELFAEKIDLLPFGSERDLEDFMTVQEEKDRTKIAFKKVQ